MPVKGDRDLFLIFQGLSLWLFLFLSLALYVCLSLALTNCVAKLLCPVLKSSYNYLVKYCYYSVKFLYEKVVTLMYIRVTYFH